MTQKDLLEQPDFLFVISEFNFFKSHRLNLIRFLSTKYKSIVIATNLEEVTSEEIEKLNLPLGVKFQDYYLNRSSIGILSNFLSVFKLFINSVADSCISGEGGTFVILWIIINPNIQQESSMRLLMIFPRLILGDLSV